MSTEQAFALANLLARTLPSEGQSFDDYLADALARWPTLSDDEVNWAIQHAADISRRDGNRLSREADEQEVLIRR